MTITFVRWGSAMAPDRALSEREILAVTLSRELADGEFVVGGGVRSAVPMAAIFLAQRLRAPNITVLLGMGAVNPRPTRIWPSAADHRYAADCEAFVSLEEIFELTERGRLDVAFYGGLQIDRLGNVNLSWIGEDRRIRGPGVANAALGLTAARTILYAESHTPRVFVDAVDFVTIRGYETDGSRPPGSGGGPSRLVTPLGIFDFPPPSRAMHVRALAPGITSDEVEGATAFELDWPSEPQRVAPPSRDEWALLRELDPDGLLRT